MTAWATTARRFLANYRRMYPLNPFESAWSALLRAHHPPGGTGGGADSWSPGTVEFAKDAFREGYYRRDVIASASIIGEDYDDDAPQAGGTVLGMGTVIA